MIWLFTHALPPLPSRQQVVSLFQSSCMSHDELTDRRERGGAKSYDGKQACSPIIVQYSLDFHIASEPKWTRVCFPGTNRYNSSKCYTSFNTQCGSHKVLNLIFYFVTFRPTIKKWIVKKKYSFTFWKEQQRLPPPPSAASLSPRETLMGIGQIDVHNKFYKTKYDD